MKRLRLACVLGVVVLAACTVARRPAPPSPPGIVAPVGFPAAIRHLSTDGTRVEVSAEAFERQRREATGGPLRILALSGGGAGGAFGAGALVGLTRRGERPQFDVVTGVSTGALLAPFAFLGPDWDAQMMDAFTSRRIEDHLAVGTFSLLLGSSRSRGANLKSLVNHYITGGLVKAVAREAAAGRVLLVVTTDLDRQEAVIWNMGRIAAVGGERARRLFRDVLVASASVPGLFSPALIRVRDGGRLYDEMHVDGNTTTSMLVASEATYFMPLSSVSLRGAQVYVLMNGQLSGAPSTTQLALGTILSRSFTTAMMYMSRTQILEAKQFADQHGMSLHVTAIAAGHPSVDPLDFRVQAMRGLFDYGERCAEDGQLWTTVDQLLSYRTQEGRQLVDPRAGCPGL
jgi:predicted acylesterase/phospholipase RssA